ncbi:hypothetical protein S40293_06651 [Stachybotrys chartarum IBT 40293]|nr:hypothetical protein S40293_06651 [Stachybotrys chartarum IBT 40293]
MSDTDKETSLAEHSTKRDSSVPLGAHTAAAALRPNEADEKAEKATGAAPPDDADLDPNAVGWDGPDDPENPMNWPEWKKWANVVALSIMTILTPLGSSMFAPGVPDIMREFSSTSPTLATFVVSVYVLGFAAGPLVAAPMSEVYGRAICYNIANVLFLLFAVGTALSTNMGMLIGFRFLMGFAGATPITNGSGTVSDIFPIEQRGKALAVWAMGPLLGPCFGPVAGGYIVQSIGWRWVFWITAIAAGVISIACYFLVTETYHLTLIHRKVARLRKSTGNPNLYNKLEDRSLTHKQHFQRAIVRPIRMLLFVPPIYILALFIAVSYGVLYLMFSTFTFVFSRQYGFDEGTVGLSYLPTGVGMMLGVVTFGAVSDRLIKKIQASGRTPIPEDRLPHWLTLMSGAVIPVALFWYGWATEANTHWIVPMLGIALFCFGLMGVMMCLQTYLVDSYVQYAASVIAALTVLRSLLGALLPLAGLSMYEELGWGWGNSVLAFITLALVPVPMLFRIYGARIRARFPAKL